MTFESPLTEDIHKTVSDEYLQTQFEDIHPAVTV